MAWNEPGRGDRDKDPWGKGEGPPPLDEVIKRLKKKLQEAFSGASKPKPSSGESSFKPPIPPVSSDQFWSMLKVGAGAFVLLYGVSGIYIVEPAEEAVLTRLGRYARTEKAGPHWFARILESKTIVNVSQVYTTEHKGAMLTKDENIVEVDIAVQYSVNNSKNYLFNVVDPLFNLNQIIDSALRYVIGHSTLEEVLTSGRTQVALQIKELIESILNTYGAGIIISDVAMQPASAPENVKSAFDDAIRAQEDELGLMNQADTYSRSIKPIAEGDARRLIEEAKAHEQESVHLALGETQRFLALLPFYQASPSVTRDRLYFATMQKVLQNVTKVVVDSDKGQNLMVLPLDKLLSNHSVTPDVATAAVKESVTTLSANEEPLRPLVRTVKRPSREQGD